METAVLIDVRNVQETLIADTKRDVQDTAAYPRNIVVDIKCVAIHQENDSIHSRFDLNDVMN